MPAIWWLLGALSGLLAGLVARRVVARLRRGVVLPVGPVEVLGAVLVPVTLWLTHGRVDGSPVVALLLAALVLLLGPVDAATHRLPDAITYPALPGTAALLAVLTLVLDLPWAGFGRAASCALVVGGVAWAIAALAPSALGLGDVKLLPTLALATGFFSVTHLGLSLALAVLVAGLWSVGGMVLRLLHRRSAVPMGPFLLGAAWFVVSWSW